MHKYVFSCVQNLNLSECMFYLKVDVKMRGMEEERGWFKKNKSVKRMAGEQEKIVVRKDQVSHSFLM